MRNRRIRSGGFSLVELMVVVAIIGILATVVVVNVVGQTYDAKKARVAQDFASIKTAVGLFKVKNSRYPREISELTTPGQNGEVFIDELPPDPWGNPYIYEYQPGNRPPYVIFSYGADGSPGGQDEEDVDLDSRTLGQGNQNQ